MKACLIALPALLGTALAASAANFTINVPVELHGLQPEITQVKVSCVVQSSNFFDNNPNLNIGTASAAPQAVSNGEFNGVFAVQVNAFSGKDPAMARSYRCDLHMQADGAWYIARTNPKYPLDPAKTSKTVVTGQIPN
jgi:hypothetical protein